MPGLMAGFRVPERLAGRYALGDPLGAGGMGAVYRARDELLDRDVAVKLVLDDGSLGPDFARACVREARAAAGVRHPGIVQVYDGGVDQGVGFVVMEHVEGRTLRDLLNERGSLPTTEAVEIGARLADALAAAHDVGIVHCDVKPSNVVLPPGGAPMLVDFGIARLATTTRPLDADGARGSVHYVSPEQISGGALDGRSDVYALGALTYEMLTGRPPFEGTNAAAVAAQRLVSAPRPPRELNPAISPALERVVLGALARDPGQRYAAAAFRDALRAAASGDQTLPLGTVPIPRSDPSNPSSQPSASAAWTAPPAAPRHSLPLWAWAIGGLLALLLVAWLLVGRVGLPASSARGTVPVPNLVGRRLADVPTALKRAGLVAGEASTRVTNGPRVSTVIDQDPPADAAARSGDAVRVVVGVAR